MRSSRRIPLLRGIVGASLATFVALASHVWVGGGMPGILGIAVPWLLSLTVCTLVATLFARRRQSLVRLGASVIASQLLFHALFVLGSITPTGGIASHVHGPTAISFPGIAPVVPEGAGMWIAHALAAVLTIGGLHRGESILRALLAAASDLAAWLHRTVPVAIFVAAHPPVPRRWAIIDAPLHRDPLRAVVHRRGPPPHLI